LSYPLDVSTFTGLQISVGLRSQADQSICRFVVRTPRALNRGRRGGLKTITFT